jgi:hypothetical protein
MSSITIKFNESDDINSEYVRLKKLYPKNEITKTGKIFNEETEDEYLYELALERKKNDNGVRWTFEEILAEDGLTPEDINNMGDVELEYELPN